MDPLKVLVQFNEKQPTFGRFRIIPMCAVLCIQHFFSRVKSLSHFTSNCAFFQYILFIKKKKKMLQVN